MTLNLANLTNWGLKAWSPMGTTYVDTNTYTPDVSGNGHHGRLYGDTKIRSTKDGGGALVFDGTGDYIQIPQSSDFVFGTGDWTISLWLRKSTTSVQNILGTGYSAGWSLHVADTSGTIRLYGGGGSLDISTVISSNVWTHIALSKISGYIGGYQDGKFISGASNSGDFAAPNPLNIGVDYTDTMYFSGMIRNIMIFKGTALTQGQIKALMDATYIE